MNKSSKIYIAGHTGLIGSALIRKYTRDGYTNIVSRTHKELNLTHLEAVKNFFAKERPEYVILAAAKVGGIQANIANPAKFLIENILIQNNVFLSAHEYGVKKLLFISCGCAYPTQAQQPIKEEYLLSGKLEQTNEGFAIAKIAGMKLCETINLEYKKEFISCIAANTYGEHDHFDEKRSHVISALIKKFHHAKANDLPQVSIWGTGTAKREFIYVDDLADGLDLLMKNYSSPETINIGSGQEFTIKKLSEIIQRVIKYEGKVTFDSSKSDGMKRRLFDNTKSKALGFTPKISLEEGILRTYTFFINSEKI
ncbi:GDP-fucose synthetase [Candidatus Roizmanbacteria bacterium CG10_big_fil_rev_8_21_14_0_10_39_12]|uniref:GDP-L-fucose synthase n=1 Tax=Candidatus Roizmanbacteria bacterium CG10_big_fil_rev_8_21_14_0_10_39_12 TaxID=1974852 RepID=A0A2M8KMZ5_9BACT|nr:MAG: GDP-fucose synthetase [Candidatus Roizmanbacteria bacterium CG10_big_fil_rev_8_21_14_0_10_39_12]